MSKQKLKLLASTTPEKTCPQQPFVQVEGEFSEAQLEALADGLMKLTILYTSFKEELMFKPKLKLLSTTIPEKTRPEKSFVQLEGELTPSELGLAE